MRNDELDDDREIVAKAKPFIRSVLAFLIYLRRGAAPGSVVECYPDADNFIAQLQQDMAGVPE